MAEDSREPYVFAPWNFSWVIRGEICASASPSSHANVAYLMSEGVKHIITLSEDFQPPPSPPASSREEEEEWRGYPQCHLIPIEEFEAPKIAQIQKFMDICEKARKDKEPVCVHCRMGRGRTGVMLACYLVKFYQQVPQQAISNIRLMRPGSVETYEQEYIVKDFWDYLAWGHT
ncbi:dual specificity protein phosphatase 23-like [Oratosquilla oratoria]|uniref:dual specificity protein phosphatase 23-like n=1 Tax=Oratosquilla oratoria TaxID=337810 RepID=UPI003F775851